MFSNSDLSLILQKGIFRNDDLMDLSRQELIQIYLKHVQPQPQRQKASKNVKKQEPMEINKITSRHVFFLQVIFISEKT